MTELRKHAFLIAVLLLLVVIKFILLPIFQWQEQLSIENNRLEKKAAKISKVLTDDGRVAEVRQQLVRQLKLGESLLFSYQEEAAFKLTQQQVFERLLEKHALKASNIGWQTGSALENVGLVKYQVKIKFDGKFVDVIAMFAELESSTPWLQIHDFNITSKGQKADDLGYIRGGRVTINLFMNQSPSDAFVAESKEA
ncbi:hypothetical protein [Thalassomonas haliotis]|uniref:Uncharacterized protein n=1 Tax=Thalassomonas haliotis TaxID=485448 RepID=A0ABY7VJT5_9GAMM|nr:hypothetical protein [Thalassomonas haliotis]WDE13270.1 hypothetical protein H3N35_07475 [Thalassomonas haliotis]